MNITKEQISEWFKQKYPNVVGSYQMVNKLEEPMMDIITQCFNDLSPKWVSVDDELPEKGEAFMVTDGKYVNITEFDWEEICFLEIHGCALVNITHWMPLPLPPIEEA